MELLIFILKILAVGHGDSNDMYGKLYPISNFFYNEPKTYIFYPIEYIYNKKDLLRGLSNYNVI